MRLTSEKQIPLKIQACAHAHRLGVPRIMYEPYKESRLYLVVGPFAMVVASLILGFYWFYYALVFSWWPAWQHMVVLSIGLAWLLIGLWTLLTPLTTPHLCIYLCPKGLIYSRGKLEVIRWDQIALLYKELRSSDQLVHHSSSTASKTSKTSNAPISPLLNYTVLRDDGKHFVLNGDLPHLDRLGGFMEREIARYLLPGAISTYEAGLAQAFGALLVDARGLTLRNMVAGNMSDAAAKASATRSLPWSEFERVVLDDTTLSIYRRDDSWAWVTLSVSGIPNLWIFKGLTEHIIKYLRIPITEPVAIEQTARPSQFAAYDAGFTLFFGALSLSKDGVRLSNELELVPWEEIASFGVGESEVILKRIGTVDQWYTLPLWTVADLPLLRQAIDYAFYQQYLQ
ncbi:hypothetical protein ccbrp13_45340 [Ktedonobacteria bacterium brp13]|nr:hypothetical protein ccbrp13_45340 [Ktedonobacteria bacterium brp13]